MRLTVGPLPAAVYWRRRAVILVGIAMLVLVVSYACGGPDPVSGVSADGTPTSTPSPSTTLLRPEIPSPTPAVATTTSAAAFTLPVPATTGPCTDAEVEVRASAARLEVPRGASLDISITIKNISGRTCVRDLGATAQELRLLDAGTKKIIWSSDDCGAAQGVDNRSLEPGQEVAFTRTWLGRVSRGGNDTEVCETTTTPTAEAYELVARLDQKLSAPVAIRILAQP